MRRRVSITAAAWTAGSPAMASFSVFGSGPLLASFSNATIVSYHPDRRGAGISALVPMARHAGTLCLPRAELESEVPARARSLDGWSAALVQTARRLRGARTPHAANEHHRASRPRDGRGLGAEAPLATPPGSAHVVIDRASEA